MAARAIWKGVLRFKSVEVPDRSVHFRLLHRKDNQPVKQALINLNNEEVVSREETLRAYRTNEGEAVLFDSPELDELKPQPSRDIHILRFYPPEVIDHRWYDRPYYLGPDGDENSYAALTQALAKND